MNVTERTDIFYYETGIEAFVAYLNEEKDVFIQLLIWKGSR